MADAPDNPHQSLAIEASLQGEAYGFVRERLRLPMGLEASFGWLRHPPTLMVVPRWADGRVWMGQWKEGEPHGRFIQYAPDQSVERMGIFNKGRFQSARPVDPKLFTRIKRDDFFVRSNQGKSESNCCGNNQSVGRISMKFRQVTTGDANCRRDWLQFHRGSEVF